MIDIINMQSIIFICEVYSPSGSGMGREDRPSGGGCGAWAPGSGRNGAGMYDYLAPTMYTTGEFSSDELHISLSVRFRKFFIY